MISRHHGSTRLVSAVFGLVSLSLASSACSDLQVDPIVTATVPHTNASSGAPLAQSAPMDVLFVVDDSASMADKQQYLGEATQSFLNHLANPFCLDGAQHVIGTSKAGKCASGTPEFVAVTDIHVGIVSTSLGVGVPEDSSGHTAGPPCPDYHGHLVSGHATAPSPTLDSTSGVFQWNSSLGDISQLVADVSASVVSMGESGCGIESQLESWYRFLVQPDPYDHLEWASGQVGSHVQLVGIDNTLLAQRKAFLRPNSTVAVVMLTDENDSSIDPLSFAGTGWMLLQPGFIAPAATSACASDPTSTACTSCGVTPTDPSCATANSSATNPNIAMFHAKQRFGVDPQFPISRYASGLSNPHVPDRGGEYPSIPLAPADQYSGVPNCVNPLFAAELPADSSDDVCHLPRGPRNANQIFFTAITGVPHQLLQQDPNDPNSPLKSNLSDADYRRILGDDPAAYRFDGVDVHMLESDVPRAGITKGDPIVLGDWDTQGEQLERACTYLLPHAIDGSSVCSPPSDDPVCTPDGTRTQVYAGATPAVRELSLARALGYQAVVSSICPVHVQVDPAGTGTTRILNATNDPLFGYEPAASGLINRMAGK